LLFIFKMQNMNSGVPLFGRQQGPQSSESAWNEVDNLDVELLAEYLLDDGAQFPSGVSFDFNLDGHNQQALNSVVSPENSEDGNMPPVAEMFQPQQMASTPLAPHQQFVAPSTMTQQAPVQQQTVASFNFGIQNNGIQQIDLQHFGVAQLGQQPQQLQQPQQQANPFQSEENQSKRRRVDAPVANPMFAIAAGLPNVNAAAAMISTQQLAAAAQEAMQQGRGRRKSQAQVERRRERNRILARRTRLRKKFFFESLQKEVMDLQKENEMLKGIVKDEIGGNEAKSILEDCDAVDKLPSSVIEACGEHASELEAQDMNLVRSIQNSQHSFVITDPSLHDNPIVFASDDFLKLTGYKREQVLGRNCRFLQGTDTSAEKVKKIRDALAKGEDVTVTMVNYMADGTPFWNKLFIAALRDAQNNIVNFIGVCVKVASPEPGEAEHGKYIAGMKNDALDDDEDDYDDEAETTVKAIEGAVSNAVAAAASH